MRKWLTFSCLSAFFTSGAMGDDWPQWRGPDRDGVWQETGLIDHFDKGRLDLVWRVEIAGGYSGPTVAKGRVYVTDRVVEPKQVERIHCFDEKTGEKVWTHAYPRAYRGVSYDAGPRAAVTVNEGRAYALGAMGDLHCLDAATGAVLWKRDLNAEYSIRMPIWGIAAAPLIEGGLVILQIGGESGACVIALDSVSGKERWRSLDDQASYSAPVMIEQAGSRVLVVYTGENVVGLNPEHGGVHWQYPFPARKMIIGIADPVVHDGHLFVTNFFDGSLMLKLNNRNLKVNKAWHRVGKSEKDTEALQSIISTPLFSGKYIYGVDSYGELRCLRAKNGSRVWESLSAVPRARWATIHLVPNGDRVWMFNERGELILSELSAEGFTEISRAKLIDPTTGQLGQRGGVCWSHPAFANRHVFARNDKELVCASLARE